MSSKLIPRSTFFLAWLAATLLSGIPSTVWALVQGGDAAAATRAAGAMLLPHETRFAYLLAAAAVVHPLVSLFWAAVLWYLLPRRQLVFSALAASVAIALIDLRLIAPAFFPAVAALDFWPQLADHLMWGATFGAVLTRRLPG